jgi:hypothetical protein
LAGVWNNKNVAGLRNNKKTWQVCETLENSAGLKNNKNVAGFRTVGQLPT